MKKKFAKRLLALICCTALILCALPVSASAFSYNIVSEFELEGGGKLSLSEVGVGEMIRETIPTQAGWLIINAEGLPKNTVIPDSFQGKPIVGSYADDVGGVGGLGECDYDSVTLPSTWECAVGTSYWPPSRYGAAKEYIFTGDGPDYFSEGDFSGKSIQRIVLPKKIGGYKDYPEYSGGVYRIWLVDAFSSDRPRPEVVVPDENPYLEKDAQGIIYNEDKSMVIMTSKPETAITEYTLPAQVKELGKLAFAGETNIKSIKGMEKLTAVREGSFKNCRSLESADLSSLVGRVLAVGLFDGCEALKEVKLPNHSTAIAANAFKGCTSLKKLRLPKTISLIEKDLFGGKPFEETTVLQVYAGSYAESWAKKNNQPYEIISDPFDDMENHWAKDSAEWAYSRGLIQGTSKGKFSPTVSLDRAMAVTILHRLDGEPAAKTENDFTDVNMGDYFNKSVSWAVEAGVTNGVSAASFAPKNSVTRQDLVCMLYRYAEHKGLDVSVKGDITKFPDKDKVADYAAEALSWAVGAGAISGRANGTLDPRGTANRAEAVQMLKNYVELMGQPEKG